jgi:lipopolysaccharide export system permease protein
MRSLSFYILRQTVGPFLLFMTLMAGIVWLTQSLRLLDLVINRSQSVTMFFYLTALILPSLLTIIIPIAFFAGALYALHRLNNDSELVVMWAAGFSRFQIAVPVLLAATAAMAMTYLCNMYLMPLSERTMKSAVFDIRADIGAAILHEGSFTTPAEGLTVFIRELEPNGEIRGILVHNNRNPKRPITYIAETGMFVETQEGARLIMRDGNVEQSVGSGAQLSVLKFDTYVFNLEQFGGQQPETTLDTNERYLSELLYPEFKNAQQKRRYGTYFAEAHNRITSPFYCLVFALIALAATAKGQMARTSYALRLLVASLAAAGLRLLGYGVQALAARKPEMVPLFYLLPLAGAVLATANLAGVPFLPFEARPKSAEKPS